MSKQKITESHICSLGEVFLDLVMKCCLRQAESFFRVVAACKADSVKRGSEKQRVTALADCMLALFLKSLCSF